MSYCSPTADNKLFCYCLNSLQKIALAWNFLKPKNQIKFNLTDSSQILFAKIAKKINVGNNYWAWVDIIKYIKENNYFGDKYHAYRDKQIESTNFWINNFYPPSETIYEKNKEELGKLYKTIQEKLNLECSKFLELLI